MASAPRSSSFYQVLTEAIADLTEHGFDSAERLDFWLEKIEAAARAALIPEDVLRRELNDRLQLVYQRAIQNRSLMRVHPGISEFTLASIKPKLRAELDRRILASAQLIKLNREASIQRTLQRFSGWATSIPVGGTDVAERAEVKANVRRGIAGLPFEERRVVIDQGHKLIAAVNNIVATDGGAIAGEWRHVMERGSGYQPRPEHERRNGTLFVIRNNWAIAAGLMRLAGRQYTDEIEAPGEFVFCRCQYVYRYNLRDLPTEMLTLAGKRALEDARRQLAAVG